MRTLALLVFAVATAVGSVAHANDIDHWAGDDGKRFYGNYPPGLADDGYVRTYNSFTGNTAIGAGVVPRSHRKPQRH